MGRDQRNGMNKNVMNGASRMARKRGTRFFECPDCQKATLLSDTTSEDICPGCGSPSGRVISSAELERRMKDLASILSPNGRDKFRRQ
jgi:Zn finger protein HypA/HybF involved in hydrogenase expression